MNTIELQVEATFSDQEYGHQGRDLRINPRMFEKYANPRASSDWRQFAAKLMGPLNEKKVLDYGCGMGEESVYFAKLGATVSSIDVSPVGIQLTRQRAALAGVTSSVDAAVMDATQTTFPDNTFDIVHGLGILHHVGLSAGLAEIYRVLKPGGSGIFLEPLGNVRWVEACKGWLHQRLKGSLTLIPVNDQEENLRYRDIVNSARVFATSEIYPYRLLYRIRKLIAPQFLYGALQTADYALLKIAPFLRAFAGACVIRVRK